MHTPHAATSLVLVHAPNASVCTLKSLPASHMSARRTNEFTQPSIPCALSYLALFILDLWCNLSCCVQMLLQNLLFAVMENGFENTSYVLSEAAVVACVIWGSCGRMCYLRQLWSHQLCVKIHLGQLTKELALTLQLWHVITFNKHLSIVHVFRGCLGVAKAWHDGRRPTAMAAAHNCNVAHARYLVKKADARNGEVGS